jgi:hypothetical protein
MKLSHLTAWTLLALGSFACASAGTRNVTQEVVRVPTAEHIGLQNASGDWVGTVAWVMPDGTEQESTCTETVVAHGPFWTKSEFRMDMGPGGIYMGHGCQGYDPGTGKYMSTWIDSMSSYVALMVGRMDYAGNLVTTWDAPSEEGIMQANHSVTERTQDSYKMTFYTENERSMEINMTRK